MSRRRKSGRDVHGILLLDKGPGVSSNKALQEAKKLYQANKAGHTGSLDPLATGLLPLCFGEATKVSAFMLNENKRYRVKLELGVTTDTGDAEGKVLRVKAVPELDQDMLQRCLDKFTGEINQVPPMYSALKHQGRRLYELARLGKKVERKPRAITIYNLQCPAFAAESLTLDVFCSKGTYIRSLAEDIGNDLGCGATVTELRRLEAGCFNVTDAFTIKQLQQIPSYEALLQLLLPVDEPLTRWPKVILLTRQAALIRQGGQVMLNESWSPGSVRMYCDDAFIGIGEILADGKLIPKRLFNIS